MADHDADTGPSGMDPEIFEVFEVERDRIDAIRATQQVPDETFVTASVAPPAP